MTLAFLLTALILFAARQAPPAACTLAGPSVEAHWSGAIPPASTAEAPLRVITDVPLPGSASRVDYQSLESASGRLFISHMGAGQLVVLPIGSDPDVLAFDPVLGRLYVAAESGVVAVLEERDGSLVQLGWYRAPKAHSVAVDPATHRVYVPLANVGGRPILRVLAPTP